MRQSDWIGFGTQDVRVLEFSQFLLARHCWNPRDRQLSQKISTRDRNVVAEA